MSGPSPRAELEQAARELELVASRKKKPTNVHVRALVLPLGRLIEEGLGPEVAGRVAELRRVLTPVEEAFRRAFDHELRLACMEHSLGVDPRYLDHPRFDFEYVVEARRRLEWRLLAAELLDHDVPEELLERVAEADARLAPYLESGR